MQGSVLFFISNSDAWNGLFWPRSGCFSIFFFSIFHPQPLQTSLDPFWIPSRWNICPNAAVPTISIIYSIKIPNIPSTKRGPLERITSTYQKFLLQDCPSIYEEGFLLFGLVLDGVVLAVQRARWALVETIGILIDGYNRESDYGSSNQWSQSFLMVHIIIIIQNIDHWCLPMQRHHRLQRLKWAIFRFEHGGLNCPSLTPPYPWHLILNHLEQY